MNWKNSSVQTLLKSGINDDPIEIIREKARDLVIKAYNEGWMGPPFDPIKLAQLLGYTIMPNEDVIDARTIPGKGNKYTIEYNPYQRESRINFSIAHEIGHTFFPDCSERIRNRENEKDTNTLLTEISKELFPFQDKKWNKLTYSKWAVLVRDYLSVLVYKLPIESHVDIADVTVNSERGFGSILVSDNVSQYKSGSNIRTTTIHDVKGETLDSVMIVSSLDKKSKGGHWEDWFNQTPSSSLEFEHKRYGYVAFSKPKHLLVLATPKLNPENRSYFESIGFKIENLKIKQLF
jgi:hypothetical protein